MARRRKTLRMVVFDPRLWRALVWVLGGVVLVFAILFVIGLAAAIYRDLPYPGPNARQRIWVYDETSRRGIPNAHVTLVRQTPRDPVKLEGTTDREGCVVFELAKTRVIEWATWRETATAAGYETSTVTGNACFHVGKRTTAIPMRLLTSSTHSTTGPR